MLKRVPSPANKKILEVIVTSCEEAKAAEAGGADRLEVVRSLEKGGLTPEIEVVREIVQNVAIPVRIMVREKDNMSVEGEDELRCLRSAAQAFATLPINGLVLGFLLDSEIDIFSLQTVLSAAPHCPATFHRAFESVRSPQESIALLKSFPQIDRILVRLTGEGGKPQISDLVQWQEVASPEITFIAGIGLQKDLPVSLKNYVGIHEIHVGRLVREPQTAAGRVSAGKIAELKSVWT